MRKSVRKQHLQVLQCPRYFAILVLAHTSDPRNWIVGDPTVMQVDEEIHMFTNGGAPLEGPGAVGRYLMQRQDT